MRFWKDIERKMSRSGKTGLACLLAVAFLTCGGISYAIYTHTIDVTGRVFAETPANVLWAVSNDDGKITNAGTFKPIDPKDNGLDPSGTGGSVLKPAVPGKPCDRWDLNVASTTTSVSLDTSTISVAIVNGYPYYNPTVFFSVINNHSKPGIIAGIELNNINSASITTALSGIAKGQVIQPGQTVAGALGLEIEQNAPQNSTCSISLRVILSSSESIEGGTPGFWKINAENWNAGAWSIYKPEMKFSKVFGVAPFNIKTESKRTIFDPTLLQALGAYGSGINALARQAAASLLNATSPAINYSMNESEIIAAVQAALAPGGNPDALAKKLALLNVANNPLDQH
jgi:hypothetical protein